MLHSAQEVYNYSGIYISYSLSSSSNALKVEPYLITPADSNDHVKVVHMSAYNTTHFGTAVFNNHQNAYIFFNEREAPQLALFTICWISTSSGSGRPRKHPGRCAAAR